MTSARASGSTTGIASLAGVLGVLAISGCIALTDSEFGIGTWLELRSAERVARERVASREREVERLRGEVEALASDPLAMHRAIREDLELALPGEVVVRFLPQVAEGPAVEPREPDSTTRF